MPQRKIDKLIVHCSATDNPQSNKVDNIRILHISATNKGVWWDGKWQWGRGWRDIGYHYYIDPYGVTHNGRKVEVIGAHCEGQNAHSIGICLGGLTKFYPEQFEALKTLIQKLCSLYQLHPLTDIYPHNAFTDKKTCPNFNLKEWLNKEFSQ